MNDPAIALAVLLGACALILLIKTFSGLGKPDRRTQRRLDQD